MSALSDLIAQNKGGGQTQTPTQQVRQPATTQSPLAKLLQQGKPQQPAGNLFQQSVTQPISSVLAGQNQGTADFFRGLDAGTIGLVRATGRPELRSGTFGQIADVFEDNAAKLRKSGVPRTTPLGDFASQFYEGFFGTAPIAIGQIMALKGIGGLPTFSALASGTQAIQENKPVLSSAAMGAAEGLLLHGVLKGTGMLPKRFGVPAAGAAFGIPSALSGAPAADVAAQTAIGAGLTLPGKAPSFRQFEAQHPRIVHPILGKTYQNIINGLAEIDSATARAKVMGFKPKPGRDPTKLIREYSAVRAQGDQIIRNNTLGISKKTGKLEPNGEGLAPIMNDFDRILGVVEKSPKTRMADFQQLMVAQRVLFDLQREPFPGAKRNIADQKVVDRARSNLTGLSRKYGEGFISVRGVAKRLVDFQKRHLHLLVDSGVLSQKEYERIVKANPHFIPFKRLVSEIESKPFFGGKARFTDIRNPLKRIKSAELEVGDVFESVIENTHRILDVSLRNRVFRAVVGMADFVPNDISPIKARFFPTVVRPSEIKVTETSIKKIEKEIQKAGDKAGGDVSKPVQKLQKIVKDALVFRGMTEPEADVAVHKLGQVPAGKAGEVTREIIRESILSERTPEISTIFRPSPFKPGPNVIEGRVNGQRKFFQVNENLQEAMSGMTEAGSNIYVKLLSVPARWLKIGATIVPEFVLRNFTRDQFTAYLQTKFGFRPFIDSAEALGSVIKKDALYQEWVRSGGAFSGFVELNRANASATIRDIMGRKRLMEKLNVITRAEDVSIALEQATRLGVFKAAKRSGLGSVDAALASREATVDFARRGAQTRDVSSLIAFWNAQVQGTDRFIRATAADPAGMAMKGVATITIPSIFFYMLNRNDPDYIDRPRWEKDLFWMFRFNKSMPFIRIPKPFLPGFVFGSMVERFMEFVDQGDRRALDGLGKEIINATLPVQGGSLVSMILPTALSPLIENTTNHDFFRSRHVVSPRLQDFRIPSAQHGRYTSSISKDLGKLFNYSPDKIENAVNGYLGGTGRYMLEFSERLSDVSKKAQGIPVQPRRPRELADIPVIRAFVSRTSITGGSANLNQFYDELLRINQADGTLKNKLKTGDVRSAQNIARKFPEYALASTARKFQEQLSKIRTTSDAIIISSLSDEQKRVALRNIDKTMVTLAGQFVDIVENFRAIKGVKRR